MNIIYDIFCWFAMISLYFIINFILINGVFLTSYFWNLLKLKIMNFNNYLTFRTN